MIALAALALPALLVGGIGWWLISRNSGPSDEIEASTRAREVSATSDQIAAWVAVQSFVEARLKSPKSADFPFGGHRHVTPLGDNRFRVRSYVDAQNAFGADVRTNFDAVVRKAEADWILESLTVE